MPIPRSSPSISRETLSFHHDKHHKAYIDKTNAAIKGTALAEADLETVVAESRGKDKALFNNAAQAWNHGFYWNSLTPEGSAPDGELAELIDKGFGSLDQFKEKFAQAGSRPFRLGLGVARRAPRANCSSRKPMTPTRWPTAR